MKRFIFKLQDTIQFPKQSTAETEHETFPDKLPYLAQLSKIKEYHGKRPIHIN